MYPKKSCLQFPRNCKQKPIFFFKKIKKLSSSLVQPNLRGASLKTHYNKSINSYNQPKTEQKRLQTILGALLTSLPHFIGNQCTNKSCERVFTTHHELVRQKTHKEQKMTPCADMVKAVKVYSVDDNRTSSLQPLRIVKCLLSCDLFTHDTQHIHSITLNSCA